MALDIDLKAVDGIIEIHGAKPSKVIAILQDVQEKYRYIPREVFPYLSSKVGLSEAKIYSVATFYEKLFLRAQGPQPHQGL